CRIGDAIGGRLSPTAQHILIRFIENHPCCLAVIPIGRRPHKGRAEIPGESLQVFGEHGTGLYLAGVCAPLFLASAAATPSATRRATIASSPSGAPPRARAAFAFA